MRPTIIVDEEFDTGFALNVGAAVSFNSDEVIRPTSTIYNVEGGGDIIPWGESNDFPQKVIEDLAKDTLLKTALHKDAQLLVSGKLRFGIADFDDEGNEIYIFPEKKLALEVQQFIKKSAVKSHYLIEGAVDLKVYHNLFPEIILSQDRKTITSINVQAAEKCRWKKQNPSTNMVEECWISSNWPDAKPDDKKDTVKVPVLDPYYDPANTLRERTDSFKYIFPVSYPTPGSEFYQLSPWDTIRSSGWLKIAQCIPKYKDAILKNASFLRYQIEFSNLYWEWKYPDFKSLTPEERKLIKETELTAIQNCLNGYEQAGKNVVTSFKSDPNTGKDWPGVKISAIDQKLNDELFLKDDERASSHKLAALGVHPALFGHAPGSGKGGYGGSDIREAYNLHVISNTAMLSLLLAPLNMVADYNWPDKNIEFWIEHQYMTTLNTGKEIEKKSTVKKEADGIV